MSASSSATLVEPDPSTVRRSRRRLVICLDGTWNNRDDSTNVLHHFSLAHECLERAFEGESATQLRFYHEGVGTGPLDRITGGGFGFGLEANVRAAYNWLIQNFQQGTTPEEDDEVYVFGFSRGAYTARSLVGFIASCGLLKRGSPLTVTQLWTNYCVLGREREARHGIMDRLFKPPVRAFDRITDLMADRWNPRQWQREKVNATEALLMRWSRRVRITYLGLYDTVGAIGFDALAVPVLRSKLALHHNMRPTTIVQHCRHALALNEYRSNFNHTPFMAYIGEEAAAADADDAHDWDTRIEQRWFAGAHSNIGGGCNDNTLAIAPMRWIFAGARDAGLKCEDLPAEIPLSHLPPSDSFGEFARPLWTALLRAKRHYRPISPGPRLFARTNLKDPAGRLPGYSLVSINETIDPSVVDYFSQNHAAPPNLVAHVRRDREKVPEGQAATIAESMAGSSWPEAGVASGLWLALWATAAAAGLDYVNRLFEVFRPGASPLWLATVLGIFFVVVDWGEHHVGHRVAVDDVAPRGRAFLDSVYWTRAIGVVLALAGIVSLFGDWLRVAWLQSESAATDILGMVLRVVVVSAFCVVTIFIIRSLSRAAARGREWTTLTVLSIGVAALLAFATYVVGWIANHAALALFDETMVAAVFGERVPLSPLGGVILLVECGLFYFLQSFAWVGAPAARMGLAKPTRLQSAATPAAVQRVLVDWAGRIGAPRHRALAPGCLCQTLREGLWRDIIGFIPVYVIVLGGSLWLLQQWIPWVPRSLQGSLFLLPLIAAAADYAEDALNLEYLRRFEQGRPQSTWLTGISFAMTVVKFGAFIPAIALTLLGLGAALSTVATDPRPYGWRGVLALAGATFQGAVLVVGALAGVITALVGTRTPAPAATSDTRHF